MKNNKGFTLVELVAVIIILGILLLIAIPNISKYVEESRKKSYVETIKNTIKSAGASLSKIDKSIINKETTYYIPITCIETENGIPKSPYNDFDNAYIVAGWEINNYNLYFYGRDKSGVGTKTLKKITEFDVDDLEYDISKETIEVNRLVDRTTKIMILDENDCTSIIEKQIVK